MKNLLKNAKTSDLFYIYETSLKNGHVTPKTYTVLFEELSERYFSEKRSFDLVKCIATSNFDAKIKNGIPLLFKEINYLSKNDIDFKK